MSAAPFAPLPWHGVPWHVEEGPAAVRCVEGWVVCHTSSDIDAEFIARAANCHHEMLAALEAFVDGFDPDKEYDATDTAYVVFGEKAKLARAAIAKALGRTPNEIGETE